MGYLYTPRYCYISPLCFTAQRRLEVHDQLLLTAYLLTPAIAPTRSDARHRHRQTLAAADPRDGGGADRSRVDLERGTAVPRAAVAAARGGVSKQWWWAAARGGGLSRRRASTRPASRTSTEGRGPLGQTAPKDPLRWCGIKSTVPGMYHFDEQPRCIEAK
jgi:hypothetical protein